MTLITMDEAAERRGVPRKTLEAWAVQGLLTLHAPSSSAGLAGPGPKLVDEEELDRAIESIGWLQVSAQGWPGPPEEA